MDQVQPGDILIPAIAPSIYRKIPRHGKLLSNLTKKIQGIPYTSSKLVVSNKTLIGYGLPRKGENRFNTFSFPVYLRLIEKGILLRHKDITSDKSKKIIEFANKKINLPYSYSDIFKSLISRLFGERINVNEDISKLSDKELLEYTDSLICSSIIAIAYKYAGLRLNFGVKNLLNVWPKDFILSSKFKIIAKIGT